jgi:hypothetical protein
MKQEEIKKFDELNVFFQNDCHRVAEVLMGFFVYRDPWYSDIRNASTFEIQGDEVAWEGRDRDNDLISGTFPSRYLSMSNEDIEREAKERNEEYLKELEEKDKAREEKRQQEKYEQYLKLKKEFEK